MSQPCFVHANVRHMPIPYFHQQSKKIWNLINKPRKEIQTKHNCITFKSSKKKWCPILFNEMEEDIGSWTLLPPPDSFEISSSLCGMGLSSSYWIHFPEPEMYMRIPSNKFKSNWVRIDSMCRYKRLENLSCDWPLSCFTQAT